LKNIRKIVIIVDREFINNLQGIHSRKSPYPGHYGFSWMDIVYAGTVFRYDEVLFCTK